MAHKNGQTHIKQAESICCRSVLASTPTLHHCQLKGQNNCSFREWDLYENGKLYENLITENLKT